MNRAAAAFLALGLLSRCTPGGAPHPGPGPAPPEDPATAETVPPPPAAPARTASPPPEAAPPSPLALGEDGPAALDAGAPAPAPEGSAGDVPAPRDGATPPGLAVTTVITNTLWVEDLAASADSLWVATRGGLEQYSLAGLSRVRLFTTLDGLDTPHVRRVEIDGGTVRARTPRGDCVLEADRFACSAASPLPPPPPAVGPLLEGARVVERLEAAGRLFIGTAGAGVWIDGLPPRRLSPEGQVCSNHVRAMAEHGGRIWLGSFDEGICVAEGDLFRRVDAPFRMVNDLAATPRGLYVAASEGLFVTTDGASFARVDQVVQEGVNGLAFDGAALWVTTPGSLWRLPVGGGAPGERSWWRPAGSTALQAVASGGGAVWLASEDCGAIRLRGDGFEIFDRAAGLPSSWAVDVAVAPDGTAWVATLRHGVVAISPDGRHRVVAGLPDSWILHVGAGEDGVLRVGTQGGAVDVDAAGLVRPIVGLSDSRVHALLETGGRLWAATELGLSIADLR